MKCPVCGNENKRGTKFCTQCGYKFKEKSDDKMPIYGQKEKENFRVANRGYDLDREYDFDEKDEVREKKGLGIIKTTAIFIVAFLVIGVAGIFAWNSGILSALTGSSNNHYSKNLKKSSDSKNEKSNEAEGTTLDDWAALENQDAAESDTTTESVAPTTATTEATQGTTAVSDAQESNFENENATVQNSTNTTAKSSSAKEYADNNKKAFYGIWAQASQDLSKAKKYKADLEAKGWKCSIFLTSEWENLNKEDWYAISVGIYSSKAETENNLKNIQADYADAYVKYSGDYCN